MLTTENVFNVNIVSLSQSYQYVSGVECFDAIERCLAVILSVMKEMLSFQVSLMRLLLLLLLLLFHAPSCAAMGCVLYE